MEDKLKKHDFPVNAVPRRDDERPADCNDEELFSIEEITLEEMAIDGICGVY